MIIKSFAVIIYASLIIAGGSVGYIKHQSIASIGMSMGFASLLLLSAWGMIYRSTLAYFTAIGLTSLLLAFFSYRYYMKQQFMPPGLIALISLIMLGILLSPSRKKIYSCLKDSL